MFESENEEEDSITTTNIFKNDIASNKNKHQQAQTPVKTSLYIITINKQAWLNRKSDKQQ